MSRPLSVTLLALGVLIFTGANLTRFIQAVRQWVFLSTLPLTVPPLYLAISGLAWGLVGFFYTWGLWRADRWAARGVRIFTPVYAIYYWVDRIFLVRSPGDVVSWPFHLGVTLIVLFLVVWILSRPRAKAFFGELHD